MAMEEEIHIEAPVVENCLGGGDVFLRVFVGSLRMSNTVFHFELSEIFTYLSLGGRNRRDTVPKLIAVAEGTMAAQGA
jgi:hypothetical protein